MKSTYFASIRHAVTRLGMRIPLSLTIAVAVANISPLHAFAQEDHHDHMPMAQRTANTAQQTTDNNALVKVVRDATERFKDVKVAEAEGYTLQFGCVSGDEAGAMGLHYVNGDLVAKGVIDANRPQIVIYEATPDGGRKLIGADYLVIADQWNAKNPGAPELMGQYFHLFPSPNRFGLPAFYTLHVWAWKTNPNGAFVNWHPNVSCNTFNDKK